MIFVILYLFVSVVIFTLDILYDIFKVEDMFSVIFYSLFWMATLSILLGRSLLDRLTDVKKSRRQIKSNKVKAKQQEEQEEQEIAKILDSILTPEEKQLVKDTRTKYIPFVNIKNRQI